MIAKAEVLQKLKKMGMIVADDASVVTVLLPKDISFETGLKDVRKKLAEIGYEASFCVKQSKDAVPREEAVMHEEPADEEQLTEEEIKSYMAVDSDEQFSLDDDGQFSLGLDF